MGVSALSRGEPWEGLSVLVDGVVVKSVLVAGFREGILAHWPPEIDEEMLAISSELYLPTSRLGYSVIEYVGSLYKYIVLVLGEKVIVFQVDKRVRGELMGKRLLEAFSVIYPELSVERRELLQENI